MPAPPAAIVPLRVVVTTYTTTAGDDFWSPGGDGTLIILGVFLVIRVVFLAQLKKCLVRVRPENRAVRPDLVWLDLISMIAAFWTVFAIRVESPVLVYFGLVGLAGPVWMGYMVLRIAESLRREYHFRKMPAGGDFGRGLGLLYVALSLAVALLPVARVVVVRVMVREGEYGLRFATLFVVVSLLMHLLLPGSFVFYWLTINRYTYNLAVRKPGGNPYAEPAGVAAPGTRPWAKGPPPAAPPPTAPPPAAPPPTPAGDDFNFFN